MGALQQLLLCGNVIPIIDYRTFLTDTSDATTYTFTSADIGSAISSRIVGVIVCGANNNRTVATVTIGGISAFKQVEVVGSANATASLWTAAVPTGTTGNIVVTWTAGQVRCSVAIWAMYYLASGTAAATASSTSTTANLNMNVLAGDVLFVGGIIGATGSTAPTGYTERYDTGDAEGEGYSGGDYTVGAAETPRTITMTWTSASGVVASVGATFR